MVTKEINEIPTRLGLAGLGLLEGKPARLWLPGMGRQILRQSMAEWADGYIKPTRGKSGLAERIAAYFDGERVEFPDEVDLSSTPQFAQSVLLSLQAQVKWGQTITYSGLARLCRKPNAARAVGGAMARNPIPLIIPCHRVIRSNGGLGGFSGPGETKLKRLMLELEAGGAI